MTPTATTTIRDETGRVLGTCDGPDGDGHCPQAAADGSVPCAGHVLRTQSTGRAGWELRVPPSVTGCPLTAPRMWGKQPGRRWGRAGTTA